MNKQNAVAGAIFTEYLAQSKRVPIFEALLISKASILLIFKLMTTEKTNIPSQIVQHFWTHIVKASGTKYFLVLVFAVGWMMIFDRYNVPAQIKMANQIKQESTDLNWYLRANEQLDDQRVRLETNEEELERIAREKFLMSKPGEVVYLIK